MSTPAIVYHSLDHTQQCSYNRLCKETPIQWCLHADAPIGPVISGRCPTHLRNYIPDSKYPLFSSLEEVEVALVLAT